MNLKDIADELLKEAARTYVAESKPLRDASGKIVGKLGLNGSTVTLSTASGRQLGSYDAVENKTRDHTGRLVGYGNQLGVLLSLK